MTELELWSWKIILENNKKVIYFYKIKAQYLNNTKSPYSKTFETLCWGTERRKSLNKDF